MKIEKLIFKNINSLAGEFEIDFQNLALTQSGMFVITGPTGSGKTTILDAVSFALFGRTPRQKHTPQKHTNEIMTYGADECFSMVYFEQDGVHYRSSVSHKRTSRKNALQPFGLPSYQLHSFSEKEGWKELATKAEEFSQAVPRIIGLTFENFKRCMLLAQGEFAVFLKAKENVRAQVLSTITGTEIYDRIGRVAHERVVAAQRQLDALQPKEEMPKEERKKLEADRDNTKAVGTALDKQLEEIRFCLKWIEDEARQKKVADEAEVKAREASLALKEFEMQLAPALKRADASSQIKPQAELLSCSLKQLHDIRAKKEKSEEKLKIAEDLLKQCVSQSELAESELADKGPDLQTKLEAVQTKMSTEETELRMLKNVVTDRMTADAQARKKAGSLRIRIAELTVQLKQGQTALLRIRKEQEKMADAAQLGERLPLIKARLKDWLDAPKVQGSLLPHAQIESALESALASQSEAEARPAGLRTIAALKRAQLDIEDKLAAMYLDFRDGKIDRCPCCGSTTPGERHAVCNEEVKAAEAAVVQAERAVKQGRDKVRSLETMLRVSALRQEFIAALGAEVESLAAAQQQVEALEKRFADYTALQEELHQREKKCDELKAAVEKESALSEEVNRTAEESARLLVAATEEYNTRNIAFEKRWGVGVTSNELAAQLKEKLAHLKHKADSAKNQLEAARINEAKIRSAHDQLAVQLPDQKKLVTEQQTEFDRQLKKYGFADSSDYEDAYRNDMPRREWLQQLQNQRTTCANTSCALSMREAAALAELRADCPLQEGDTAESLAEKLVHLDDEREKLLQKCADILAILSNDDFAREANAGIKLERERLENELNQYALLKKVLGDSQEGFKKFAQQITFDLLLARANVELRKFTNRYELRRCSKEDNLLDLVVIDHELGIMEGRTATNLSGGETFLVSLALALGLSHLSQATRIDSLFLDEGFGTLDPDTLEQVITNLQKLHETGKTIGIISHVPTLSERIPGRIEVQRTREGLSTLTGNPAVKCIKPA